jgi:uncharacterized coiled-coil protein SlyX
VIGAFDELEFRLATSESLCDALQARLAAAESRIAELTEQLAFRNKAWRERLAAAEALLRKIIEDHRRYRGVVSDQLIERAKEACND